MTCCNGGGGCSCGPANQCPACQIHPSAGAYQRCTGSTPACPFLFNRLGFLLAGVLNPTPKMPATERQVWQHYRRAFLRLSNNGAPKYGTLCDNLHLFLAFILLLCEGCCWCTKSRHVFALRMRLVTRMWRVAVCNLMTVVG